jgi:hypothetical protein
MQMGVGCVEEGRDWWRRPGRASDVGSRENVVIGEAKCHLGDMILSDAGHRKDNKTRLAGEEALSAGVLVSFPSAGGTVMAAGSLLSGRCGRAEGRRKERKKW